IENFLSYLDTLESHNVYIKQHKARLPGRVRCMTAHRSKGQEFEYVYITQAFDGHWGNRRRGSLLELPTSVYALSGPMVDDRSSNDDERRLFYVALTRAKKEVH